jgi:hypothetical protein
MEKAGSDLLSASLDYYRDVRDAISEAMFFSLYGTMFSVYMPEERLNGGERPAAKQGREAAFVKEALAAINSGGYPEALARAGALLARKGQPLPLSRLQLKKELLAEYKDLLPDLPSDTARRIRGEQDVIVEYEPESAIRAFPKLLTNIHDRDRFLALLNKLQADERVQAEGVTPEQASMLERIRGVLSGDLGNGGPEKPAPRPVAPEVRTAKPQGAKR